MIAIMPMAGRGSRFLNAGIITPKPFIDVLGKPMFIRSLESLRNIDVEKIIFVVLRQHYDEFNLVNLIESHITVNYEIVITDQVTEGQLQTVLLTKSYFSKDEEIIILPSDTVVIDDVKFIIMNSHGKASGIISVIEKSGSHWSFARLNEHKSVIEVAEKKRISNFASTGVYYFKSCIEFFDIAERIIIDQERTNGEFYIIPVYQKMIDNGALILPSFADEMWDMGNPTALIEYTDYLMK